MKTMMHSPERMGQRLSRRPNEEKPETQSTPQQSAPAAPPVEHAKTVSKFLRAHGHDSIADEIDQKMGVQSTQGLAEEPQAADLPPYADAAKHILWHQGARVHGLPFPVLADLYDLYYSTKSSADLAAKLEPMDIPSELKHSLYVAKQKGDVPTSLVERVVKAIESMKNLNESARTSAQQSVLKIAEKHPLVMKLLADSVKGKE